ncbi:MAG: MBOAT family protein [Lachnospiraceae bacterium]|nr:MBOAT family protein [Lachnospiraceae bacterium]
MVFSSIVFLVCFLPTTIILYYIVPSIKWKNLLLLISSLLFYAWGEPIYVLLMIASIIANYFFGRLIHSLKQKGARGVARTFLLFALLFNLGLLLYFKYFNFLIDVFNKISSLHISIKEIALPIGISFFTFQGMSYVIDVWRDNPKNAEESVVQKNIIDLAMYIAMFPQLIAGPIVRYHDIRRFLRERRHSFDQFSRGIEVFVYGLAKKVLIANTLGQTVDAIMISNVNYINAPIAWLGTICYSLQLFFDFYGYSQMAIGLGKMFGFEFQKNFDYPYSSFSITDFWRRWHISLSQWFRDYLYIPLGGSRKGNVYFNLLIVFIATGVWHGAGFGFLIWGLWHSLFVILERFIRNHHLIRIRIPKVLKWFYTMFVVLIGWTLFKLVDLRAFIYYFEIMFGIVRPTFVSMTLRYYLDARTVFMLIAATLCCIPWQRIISSRFKINGKKTLVFSTQIVRRVFVIVLLVLCYLFISNSKYNPFIYFRF